MIKNTRPPNSKYNIFSECTFYSGQSTNMLSTYGGLAPLKL
jgi:hypothetical protein